MSDQVKRCSKCKESKTEDAFAPSAWKNCGYCRQCASEYKHVERGNRVRSAPEYRSWKDNEFQHLETMATQSKYRAKVTEALKISGMSCSFCNHRLTSPAEGLLFKEGKDVTYLVERLARQPSSDLAKDCNTVCRNCAKTQEWENRVKEYAVSREEFKEKMRTNRRWKTYMEEVVDKERDGG